MSEPVQDVDGPPLISSPEFVQYCHLLLDLHFAMQAGDEEKADELRDKMDTPGWNMSGLELEASKLLSGDLYDMEEVLRGTRTAKEHTAVRLRRKKYETENTSPYEMIAWDGGVVIDEALPIFDPEWYQPGFQEAWYAKHRVTIQDREQHAVKNESDGTDSGIRSNIPGATYAGDGKLSFPNETNEEA